MLEKALEMIKEYEKEYIETLKTKQYDSSKLIVEIQRYNSKLSGIKEYLEHSNLVTQDESRILLKEMNAFTIRAIALINQRAI